VWIFYRAPARFTSERKTGNGQGERQRKRNMGLVCTDTPPPPPLPCLARPASPACGHGYQGRSYSGEPPPSLSPTITHTPFQQFEVTAVNLLDSLWFGGHEYKNWYWTVIVSICVFFLLFDRTPVSRDRDCCSLARAPIFWQAPEFWTFSAWRAGTTSLYSTGESPPIKSGAEGGNAWIDDCMHGEKRPERSQQLQILLSLTVRRFSSPAPTFLTAPTFCRRLEGARSAKFGVLMCPKRWVRAAHDRTLSVKTH
jgi:hypothetical protein